MTVLILLLLLIGGTLLVTQMLTRRFGFRGLAYTLQFSAEEATEGDTVTLIETITSRKPLPLPWVKAELTTSAALLLASEQSSVTGDSRFISSYFCLFPYRKIERHWKVTCTRRGVFTVSHAVIVLSDLFGTMELSQPFPAEAKITVLPAVRSMDEVSELPAQIIGEMIRRRTLIPDRFAVCGIREYSAGDPVRDICWTASARSQQPMVWQYQETACPDMTVLLNTETRETDRDRVSDPAVYEDAIRLCAALLGTAVHLRIPVRFCANTALRGMPAETPFLSGSHALSRHLHLLAELPDTIAGRFSSLLDRIRSSGEAHALFIVTAQPTAHIMQAASADPRITVLSLRRLREQEIRPNVMYIPIKRKDDSQ